MPAYDEQGNRVVVVHPVYETPDDEGQADDRADLQTAIGNFLRMLAESGDPLAIGQTVKLLNFLAGQSSCSTKAELAKEMKVTPARISQILRGIPDGFKSLVTLKNRSSRDVSL